MTDKNAEIHLTHTGVAPVDLDRVLCLEAFGFISRCVSTGSTVVKGPILGDGRPA